MKDFSKVKIEDGVGIPDKVGGSPAKNGWRAILRSMSCGQSFVCKEGEVGAVRNAASAIGCKVSCRSVEGGVRVWKVE